MQLHEALKAWGSTAFREVLKAELARLGPGALPLQQGLSGSSHAVDNAIEAVILNETDAGDCLRVKVGIFYAGIIAGCSCADDPTPLNEQTEYCEVLLEIDKATAETRVTLLRD